MRRCPRCTSLTEDGAACSACGHDPRRPATTPTPAKPAWMPRGGVRGDDVATPMAVAALRGRTGPAPVRPLGASIVGWLAVLVGSIGVLQALYAVYKVIEITRDLPQAFQDIRANLLVLVLIGLCISLAILLVGFAFLRGSRWAWWVLTVYHGLATLDALFVTVVATALPFHVLPDVVFALRAVGFIVLAIEGGLLATLLVPSTRRYFFHASPVLAAAATSPPPPSLP